MVDQETGNIDRHGFLESDRANHEKLLSQLTPQEEIEAVRSGIKPAALQNGDKDFAPDLPSLSFEHVDLNGDLVTDRIYYRPGEEQNATGIMELIIGMNSGEIYRFDPMYHFELGVRLGYSPTEINDFLTQTDYLRAKNHGAHPYDARFAEAAR